MSGVEVAGFVLAGIPLIISALEHYAEGVSTIRRFRRFENELKSLKQRLATEIQILRNTCELLLRDVVESQDDLKTLVNDHGDSLWSNKDLALGLKMKLGESYTTYTGTVSDLNTVVAELKERLQVDSSEKMTWADRAAVKSYFKRAKFSLSRVDYEDLMGKITYYNQALERLTQQCEKLSKTPLRHRGESKYDTSAFQHIRKVADELFKAVRSGLTCKPACSDHHNLGLELVHRQCTPQKQHRNIDFALILSLPDPNKPEEFWKEVKLSTTSLRPEETGLLSNLQPSLSLPLRTPSTSVPLKTRKPNIKRVSFMEQAPSTGAGASRSSIINTTASKMSASVTLTSSIPTSIAPGLGQTAAIEVTAASSIVGSSSTSSQQNSSRISYLCHEIRENHLAKSDKKRIRFLSSDTEDFEIHCVPKFSSRANCRIIPLRAALGQPRFCRSDRLNFAVGIASSVLQLPESYWLRPTILEEIVFVEGIIPACCRQQQCTPQTKTHSPYKRAFLSKQFDTTPRPLADVSSSQRTFIMPWKRNPILFALGLLLVEICFERPIDDLLDDSDCVPEDGLPNDLTRYGIAKRLVEDNEILCRFGQGYQTAVEHCIFLNFAHKKAQLDDEDFQSAVYENIVVPLERDRLAFHGIF